jgi:aspartyl/glutamyl-tRNA(Asn/Gln) amidotransferase C subunit
MSRIEIKPEEINPLTQELEQVLSYSARVADVATLAQEPSTHNVNVYREDVTISCNPGPILAQAPAREGDYFGVPAIIENH